MEQEQVVVQGPELPPVEDAEPVPEGQEEPGIEYLEDQELDELDEDDDEDFMTMG